jgi:hypothetical protein
MASSPLELRPRNPIDLIDGSVRLYRRHFGTLLGISAVLLVPFGVTYTIGFFFYYKALGPMMQIGQVPPDANIDLPALIAALVFLVSALLLIVAVEPLSQGALALAISEEYLGREIGVWEAYRRVVPYWGSLFLVGIVFGLVTVFGPLVGAALGAGGGLAVGAVALPQAGPLAAGIGGVVGALAGMPLSFLFFTWFVLYKQTMVLGNARGMDSLQRARALVTGHGWHVFATLLLTLVAVTIATYVLAAPVSVGAAVIAMSRPQFLIHAQLLAQCMSHIVNVLLGPVFMIVQTLTYYDLRIRKEGFDLQMMAAAIEGMRGRRRAAETGPAGEDAPTC